MTLCGNCGVELDDGLKICPLCGKDPDNMDHPEMMSGNYPSSIIRLHKKENRKFLWELSGIIAFSGIVVTTIVDLLVSKELKWSLYSDVSLGAVWIMLTFFRFIFKKPFILVLLLMVTILTALFSIDYISAGRDWFISVGLPVTLTGFLLTCSFIILYRTARFKGLNFIASSLILLSGFCIVLEMTLDKYLDGFVHLRWSLIAAVSILPVTLVFYFYHYRLKKGNRLDSFFHI